MNKDEINLRNYIRLWRRRFVDQTPMNLSVLIKIKDDFIKKYGHDEFNRIQREVEEEVADEMSKRRV